MPTAAMQKFCVAILLSLVNVKVDDVGEKSNQVGFSIFGVITKVPASV
jgi:hypothetical protein